MHLIIGANNTAMTGHGFQYIVRTTLVQRQEIAQVAGQGVCGPGALSAGLPCSGRRTPTGKIWRISMASAWTTSRPKRFTRWAFSRDRADFRLPVNELKGIDADVILFAGLEPWAGDFLRSARGVGLKTPIIGAFSDTPEMRKRAGEAMEDSMYFEMYDMNSLSPENQAFVTKYRARFGSDPSAWAAQGYDALHILAKAVKFTGSRNPLDLSYAIRYMDPWEGANGRYKFDSKGELEDKPIFLMRIVRGKPVMIQKSEPAEPNQGQSEPAEVGQVH